MSVGNEKGEAFGGHLNRAVVSATCEMVITVIDGKVDRVYDEETGLNVFKFANVPFEKEVLKKSREKGYNSYQKYREKLCENRGLRFGRVLCKIIGQG